MQKFIHCLVVAAAIAFAAMGNVTTQSGHVSYGMTMALADQTEPGGPPSGATPKPFIPPNALPGNEGPQLGVGRNGQPVASLGDSGMRRSRCEFSAANPPDDAVFPWCRNETVIPVAGGYKYVAFFGGTPTRNELFSARGSPRAAQKLRHRH